MLQQEKYRPMMTVRAVNRFAYDHFLPALFCLVFALMIATQIRSSLSRGDWLVTARISLNLAFYLLTLALFMIRRPPVGERARPFQAVLAVSATFLPLLFAAQPIHGTSTLLFISGIVTVLGIAWSILSLAALGRCFGLFPEARGLVARGPYRWVRHPLYLGEISASLGVVMAAFSPLTLGLWLVFIGLQVWRSVLEERALSKVFPEYLDYQAKTFRLVPGVW